MPTRHHEPRLEGRRRVLIAIAAATGALCLVAAASTYDDVGPTVVTLGLVLAAGGAAGFATLVHLGLADWLTDDDQLLWKSGRDDD